MGMDSWVFLQCGAVYGVVMGQGYSGELLVLHCLRTFDLEDGILNNQKMGFVRIRGFILELGWGVIGYEKFIKDRVELLKLLFCMRKDRMMATLRDLL